MFRRIIPLILVVVILFSLSAPVFAVDASTSYLQLSYWDQFWYEGTHWVAGIEIFGPGLVRLCRQLGKDLCTESEDGYHHAARVGSPSGIGGGGGRYDGGFTCFICKYCGDSFRISHDIMSQVYSDYVADLDTPEASYGEGYVDFSCSQTSLISSTTSSSSSSYASYFFCRSLSAISGLSGVKNSSIVKSDAVDLLLSLGIQNRVLIIAITGEAPYYLVGYYWNEYGRLCLSFFENSVGYPYASCFGVYSLSSLTLASIQPSSLPYPLYCRRSLAYRDPDFLSNAAFLLTSQCGFSNYKYSSSTYELAYCHLYSKNSDQSEFSTSIAKITGELVFGTYPKYQSGDSSSYSYYYSSAVTLSKEYLVHGPAGTDSSSRPGSITGDYGVIGDNNTITNIGSQVIINEADLTYTNPATGETQTIESWQYAYGNRKYTIVTGDGNTVTVTYGDENITINEGDTVYNIYYMVDIPEETPPCSHSYTHTVLAYPTCKVTGLDQYKCELCGHSYQAATPATGHTWKILQDVNTQYDDTGALIQEGYTIYECEICGEQYKSTDGSAPPTVNNGGSSGSGGSSGDSSGGGIFDKIGELLGILGGGIVDAIGSFVGFILDSLISLAQMLVDKGLKVIDLVLSFFERIPGLFGAFPAFLAAVFPFIPEDMLLIIEFGLAAVVFIGILRWLRK